MKLLISITLFINITLSYQGAPWTEWFQMDNGMKVVLSPNYETPLVNITILANHGTIDDPYGTRGYGHHIAKDLMGSRKLEPDLILNGLEHEKNFEDLGVVLDYFSYKHNFNSTQFMFHTFFEEQFLYEDLQKALELTHTILAESEFKKDPPLFWQRFKNYWKSDDEDDKIHTPQELAYLHSLRMYYDIPINFVNYGDNDYNVNKFKKASKWVDEKYAPENITLMITGNINMQYTEQVVRRIFTYWKPHSDIVKPGFSNKLDTIPKADSPKYSYVDYKGVTYCDAINDSVKYTTVGLIADAPKYSDDDYYAHWVVRHSLSLGNNSILSNLFEKLSYYDTGQEAFNFETKYHPRLQATTINFEVKNTDLNQVYWDLYNNLLSLGEEGIFEPVLEYWKEHINQEYSIMYNNPVEYSQVVSRYLNSGFDLVKIFREIEKLNKVTADEYKEIAKKYFHPDNFKIVIIGDREFEPLDFTSQFKGIEYVDVMGQKIEGEIITKNPLLEVSRDEDETIKE